MFNKFKGMVNPSKFKPLIKEILERYKNRSIDFEDARDEIHLLGPVATSDVLLMAESGRYEYGLDVLAMVLADYDYPAISFFLKCLENDDVEGVALPAAFYFDKLYNKKFKVDDILNHARGLSGMASAFKEIKEYCIKNMPKTISVNEWLTIKMKEFNLKHEAHIPEQPLNSYDENESIYDLEVELAQKLSKLSFDDHVKFDIECSKRITHLCLQDKEYKDIPYKALETAESIINTEKHHEDIDKLREKIKESLNEANNRAKWNNIKNGYENPKAYSAVCAAQTILYAISDSKNRGAAAQGFARDSIEYAGLGFTSVKEELTWQLSFLNTLL
ncbi:MAG: hypothetical protein GY714_26725 [Desulfobacterales bacterium]|nr:hypothetical protein [Desulfobacterales bacterium]MCP4161957.1 hypothetical protein [Deltaproteobacteria bacterium]